MGFSNLDPGRRAEMSAVLWGGLIVGAIDITTAVISTVASSGRPMLMLQGIAYALIGPGAFKGGWKTAVLGLLCHFIIAFGAAAAYVVGTKRLSRNGAGAGGLWASIRRAGISSDKLCHCTSVENRQGASALAGQRCGAVDCYDGGCGLSIALMAHRYAS